jgi:hypothetical protein
MLVAASAAPFANEVFEGSESEFLKSHYFSYIKSLNIEVWQNKRIVIKGCSDKPVPPEAYTTLTKRLQPLAQSIMFGEPCSTVPIYKKPKK